MSQKSCNVSENRHYQDVGGWNKANNPNTVNKVDFAGRWAVQQLTLRRCPTLLGLTRNAGYRLLQWA